MKKIIEYNEACLKTAREQKIQKPYAFLLRNTVIAYIYLAQSPNSPLSNEYHIDRAISLSDQWQRFYKDIDPDSLFHCGIFTPMKALSKSKDKDAMNDHRLAYGLFKDCRSAYQTNPSLKFKNTMYLIGKRLDLCRWPSLCSMIRLRQKDRASSKARFNGEVAWR